MYRPAPYQFVYSILLIFMLGLFPTRAVQALDETEIPPLDVFMEEVINGEADVLRGMYVPGILANPILPQPNDNASYVTSQKNVVTQFGLAERYDTIGLLAHNYLAGGNFSLLDEGQVLFLIYGDGRMETFAVSQFMRVQALQPKSPLSNFIDLETDDFFTASELFQKIYNNPGHVVLQTCIYADGNNAWGRLFIIAEPVSQALD